MSDLLNSASLVLIPSGYKEDTVYSVVPTDGSGDLSFTRASNGTRVNSAGLVEVCPWNLLNYSEDFSNAYWQKGAASITGNATTAPNGTTTADKFNEEATNDTHQIYNTFTGNTGVVTLFVYAKKAERSGLQITSDQATDPSAIFNLDTGVVYSSANCTAFIESVGNGWYKCGITYTIDQTTSYPVFRITDASFNVVYSGTAGYGIYIYGAQLNIGSTAKPYFPTTDRLNVPRLTYQNGGGGCPSLLLEKQSTNTSAQSEDFSNWATKINVTTTANYATSPDGTTNATRLQFTGSGFIYGNSGFGQTNGTVYSLSCWAKRNGSGTQSVGFFTNGSGTVDSAWTLTSEYQRFTFTYTAGNSSTVGISGASGADVSVWGWQFEASSYPTSYIPTTSASATRVADACFNTSATSLIGQTEGVLFCDFIFVTGAMDDAIIIRNTDYSTFVYINQQTSGNIFGQVQGVGNFSFSTPATNGRLKCAIAYKSGNSAFFVNGAQVGTTNTSVFVPVSMTIFEFLTPALMQVNQAVLFKTRLTNAELASLTTI
jgi:hypothetical protein